MRDALWADFETTDTKFARMAVTLRLGDRVAEIYADTKGTVTGFGDGDLVKVDWDEPTELDVEMGDPSREELVLLIPVG
jgi:hypothetical protein